MAQLNEIDRKLQEFEDKKNQLKEKYEALRDADPRYQNSWHKFTKRKKSKD